MFACRRVFDEQSASMLYNVGLVECARRLASLYFTWNHEQVGACVIFVGVIELLFGARCVTPEDANAQPSGGATAGSSAGKGGGKFFNLFSSGGGNSVEPTAGAQNASEPTFSINVTPSQVAQGASLAMAGAAAVSNASASNANAGADNPFFGNTHLSKQ